jgi:prolipoprotein diacylglyceryl transferase
MPSAFLPSPARDLWHLGPITIRAYALCVIAGVVFGLWFAGRRYARIGGRDGVILDIATIAVPAGLAGARAYSVLTDYPAYFGAGRDWTGVFRIWDGGLGMPGAILGGALGAWLVCRRKRIRLATVAGAAAPAAAFAQAISRFGNWFAQNLYGSPSTLPWAVRISPPHRVPGYQSFATFQPLFGYEALWEVLIGVAVIRVGRRFALTGDRSFAAYLALYAVGRFWSEALRISYPARAGQLRADEAVMIATFAGAALYLYLTRRQRGPGFARLLARQAQPGPPGRAVSGCRAGGAMPDQAGIMAAPVGRPGAGAAQPPRGPRAGPE